MNDLLIKEKANRFEGKRGQFVVGGFPMMVDETRQEYYLEIVDVGRNYDDDKNDHKSPISVNASRILLEKDNPYEHAEASSTEAEAVDGTAGIQYDQDRLDVKVDP